MAEAMAESRTVEAVSEFGKNPQGIARRWATEISLAKKDREKWRKQVKDIVKRYRDERAENDNATQFNILWSNVQTLGPAIYVKPPEPVVERRYRDKDPIARIACRILERTLKYQIEHGYFHRTMKMCRDDYLLTAQGVNWIRYEPTYKMDAAKLSDPNAMPDEDAEEGYEEVIDENTCVDYVHWDDYLCSPARVEDEVTWKARRAFLTRDQLKKRFGKINKEAINRIPLDHTPANMSTEEAAKPENELLKKAIVWEIWDKTERKVIFIAENFNETPLEVIADPLKLDCFWPTPCPVIGTTTNDTVIPVPDYHQYKNQAQELDDLTARISLLTDAIRVAGVYDASVPELGRLLEEGAENKLYPCDQWAAFAEKGGVLGAISILPIKEMAEVLIRLYEARQQVKNDLYEITGISDIVRGMSSGSAKTATEQRIKGQFANLRLTDRQAEMSRFAKDTLEIMGELISEHFSPQTIYLMSGYEQWGVEEALPLGPPPMGHNGGPPMDAQMPPQMPPQAPQQPPMPPQQGMPPAQPGQPPMPMQGAPMPPQGAQPPIMPQGGPPQQGGMPPAPMQPPQMPPEMQEQMRKEQAKQIADEKFAKAIELLRHEKLRGFRINIETDSTIEPDQQAEKDARVEFLTAASGFLGQALEVGMTAPQMIPLMGKMLLFGVRGFRAGRELESAFEETIDLLEKEASQPKEPPPSPEEIKAKAEAEKMQMEAQFRQQEMQAEAQRQQAEDQRQAQLNQMDLDFKRQEHQMRMEELVRKTQIDLLKHHQEMEKLQAGVAMEGQKLQIQAEGMERKAAYEERAAQRDAHYDDQAAERQAQSDERKAAIAEQAMKQKASMAGKSAGK